MRISRSTINNLPALSRLRGGVLAEALFQPGTLSRPNAAQFTTPTEAMQA